MTQDKRTALSNRVSEQLDVQLLDVLAQVEALLRHGREIQRAALAVRGVPEAISAERRQRAGASINAQIQEMREGCDALTGILDDLSRTSDELNSLLRRDESESS
jgi:hypothetical protein